LREYGKVATRFWVDPKILKMSETVRLVALYLLTGPEANLIGCFRCTPLHIAANNVAMIDDAQAALDELARVGFIEYDNDAGVVFFPNWFRYDPICNQSAGKAAIKALKGLPDSPLVGRAIRALAEFDKRLPHGWRDECRHMCPHECPDKCTPSEHSIVRSEAHQEGEQGNDIPLSRPATHSQMQMLNDIASEKCVELEKEARGLSKWPVGREDVTPIKEHLLRLVVPSRPGEVGISDAELTAHMLAHPQWEQAPEP